MPGALDMPKGSELIVLSRDELAEFARIVIVAYREDEAARPQAHASSVATGPLIVDLLAFEARVKDAVVRMKPREFKLLAALAENLGHAISRERLLDPERRASIAERIIDEIGARYRANAMATIANI